MSNMLTFIKVCTTCLYDVHFYHVGDGLNGGKECRPPISSHEGKMSRRDRRTKAYGFNPID
jgi:hypothetical protein